MRKIKMLVTSFALIGMPITVPILFVSCKQEAKKVGYIIYNGKNVWFNAKDEATMYDSQKPITIGKMSFERNEFNYPIVFTKKGEIQNSFLTKCQTFNSEITFADGSNITSIGNRFLYDCASFNQPLTLPNSVKSIGNYFLYGCNAFTNTLIFPSGLESIGDNFLNTNETFDNEINLNGCQNLKSIGNYFMTRCLDFNNSLTLPNSLETIGEYFLTGCESFAKPLALPTNLISIGKNFMSTCKAFNSSLTLPNSLETIGENFMQSADNMTSPIDIQDLSADCFAGSGSSSLTLTTAFNDKPMFLDGIKIVGTHKADFLARFPNTNEINIAYRNLYI